MTKLITSLFTRNTGPHASAADVDQAAQAAMNQRLQRMLAAQQPPKD